MRGNLIWFYISVLLSYFSRLGDVKYTYDLGWFFPALFHVKNIIITVDKIFNNISHYQRPIRVFPNGMQQKEASVLPYLSNEHCSLESTSEYTI